MGSQVTHSAKDFLIDNGFPFSGICGACPTRIEKFIKHPFEVRIKVKSSQYKILEYGRNVVQGHLDNLQMELKQRMDVAA